MGDPADADLGTIIDTPNFDNPSWGKTPRGGMSMACHYLNIIDNLLDPKDVAWAHLASFDRAGKDNRPLDVEDIGDGVIVSRWIFDELPPPHNKDMLPFGPSCDRKQHYECRLPATAIIMSVYTPTGEGGPDNPLSENASINISYNFTTPVDAENSRYFWFQHRNLHADDDGLSAQMFEGAKMAFKEDQDVLEFVQTGMANRTSAYLNLALDAGAMRFRSCVAKSIKGEQVRAHGSR